MKSLKVYDASRSIVLAEVSRQVTSIGAAKAAKVSAVCFAKVNGFYSWVAK